MTTLLPSDVAQVWLKRAQSDLNLATVALQTHGVMVEDVLPGFVLDLRRVWE